MLCNKCKERPATIHFTMIAGDKMTRQDFCEVCGKKYVDKAEKHKYQEFIPLETVAPDSPEQMFYEFIAASDSRYAKDSYPFVWAVLRKALQKRSGSSQAMPAHVSGAELLQALRKLAIEKFGKQAKATLNGWGIFKCEDFGEIVFNLVEAGLVAKQDTDTKADVHGGYDFNEAFPS